MRFIRIAAALVCLLLGALVGALNTQPVTLDLGAAALHTTLGLSILTALLLGVVLGAMLIAVGVVLPLRRRLRHAPTHPIRPKDGDQHAAP